jgi:hypothetical protein
VAKLKSLEDDVKDVLRACSTDTREQGTNPNINFPQLPCSTLEEFAALNNFLEDHLNKSALVSL